MAATLALAGDTMLGRGVGERLTAEPGAALIAPEVAERLTGADAFIVNLECCISDRGEPYPDPRKPFFFRAPPVAAPRLAELGVDAVTLANNHALDYGPDALLDTLTHLRAARIAAVGAGADLEAARASLILRCGGLRVRLVGFSDHPADYAAGPERPGIAFAGLRGNPPDWVLAAVSPAQTPTSRSPHRTGVRTWSPGHDATFAGPRALCTLRAPASSPDTRRTSSTASLRA